MKSLSRVRLFATPRTVAYQAPLSVGILQAKSTRGEEVKSLSHVRLFATHRLQPAKLLCPWDFLGNSTGVDCHFLLQNGWPFPPPGDLPDTGIKPRSPALQADSLPAEQPRKA